MAATWIERSAPAVAPPTAGPLSPWEKRRALAGQMLEFSAQLVTPTYDPTRRRSRIRRGLDLATHLLPKSLDSHRSVWSAYSMYSGVAVLSFGSFGSVLSAFSIGSMLSIGSTGSILSIGSAGSVLSIGSAGSVLSIGGIGQRQVPQAAVTTGLASQGAGGVGAARVIHASATALAVGALAAAAVTA